MVQQVEILLLERARGYHLITRELVTQLPQLPKTGIAHFFICHTSAALTLNENADPTVRSDFEKFMDRLVPDGDPSFVHVDEGIDDMSAHLKSSLLGATVTIPIRNGRLAMGIWQGIYLCEFRDHASRRKVIVTLLGE